VKTRPSFSTSGSAGRSVLRDDAARLHVHRVGTNSPPGPDGPDARTAIPALSWASTVDAPRCGARRRCRRPNSGESVHGSVAKTSSPAPAPVPAPGLGERLLVEQPAARGVDDAHGRLAQRQLLATDQPDRSRRLRQVDRDEVALAQQVVEGHQADADLRRPSGET
jgi:hypothetical protein